MTLLVAKANGASIISSRENAARITVVPFTSARRPTYYIALKPDSIRMEP